MSKIAFLFSGQGSEFKGMGLELYENNQEAKSLFDQYKDIFNPEIMFYSDDIHMTQHSQPAILFYSYILSELLKKKGINATYSAGLSLGEYTALTYAKVFSIKDSLELIKLRGLYMQEDLSKVDSGMYAILNPDIKKVEEIVSGLTHLGVIQVANYNSLKQIVISGETKVLNAFLEIAKDMKLIKLNVTGAFHTPLLENASSRLNKALQEITYHKEESKVLFNVTGNIGDTSKDSLINNLTLQIKSSVKFIDIIKNLDLLGVDTFIEIGPKKVLASFVKAILPNAKIYSVFDLESLNEIDNFLKEV